jgi:putative tryptophan/tyrosine transport system substrate-binding protein
MPFDRMNRREFTTLLGGSVIAWSEVLRAQQDGPVRRIGVLMAHPEADREFKDYVRAFRRGLLDRGWLEGHTIKLDVRWGALDDAALRRRSAQELVALAPDLLLTQNTPPTASVLELTRSVPVIFVIVTDPVGSGFVKSLARPDGNATGFTIMEPTMGGKWLEFLKEIAPHVTRVAFLFNPATAPYADYYLTPFKAAAGSFGLEPITAPVHGESEFEDIFAAQARTPNSGFVLIPDGFLNVYRVKITELAAKYRLPAVYPWRFFSEAGGLLSYGADQRDIFRRAATYADRILKGEKPSQLPVQAPVKFELVINLRAAKQLGLEVSSHLQQLADEIIE